MSPGQPDSTAVASAMARAAHLLLDKDPKIFRDDLAMEFAGFDSREMFELGLTQALAALARQLEEGVAPVIFRYLRAIMTVRSRYAEEVLADAIRRGVRQYVILGAGLDSFAFRRPDLTRTLRIFEVDHPDMQQWKRARLARLGMSPPDNLTFVPVDFESDTVGDALDAAGHRPEQPTFFSWLGVTQYLTQAATAQMLRYIGSLAAGCEIVFEYIVPEELLDAEERSYFAAMLRRSPDGGHIWQGLYKPEQVAAMLSQLGYVDVTDLDAKLLDARYFAGRDDGLRVPAAAHLVKARVNVAG